MKYAVVLYDGMADYPVPALGGKTPMELALTVTDEEKSLEIKDKASSTLEKAPANSKPNNVIIENKNNINVNCTHSRRCRTMALKPKQLELLEAMLAYPALSDVKLGQLLELNNKTVGKWRKMPEFQAELKMRLAEQWKDAERLAQAKMIELAGAGNYNANKYILDSLGYAPTQKIEADISSDIQINIEE